MIIITEVKSGRERQISYDATYMWNLKKIMKMNFARQKQTHKENRLMVSKGEGAGGINWEFGINRNTL